MGTDMNSLEKEMEVLRMARQLLNEEYINRRAEDHNKWLADSDVAWRTKGIKLPYPPFAPYPTEAQILTKAQELIKFVVKEEDIDKVLPPQISEEPVIPPAPTPVITVPEPEVPHAPPQETPKPETGTLGMTDITEPANPIIETKPETKKKSFWFGGGQ
jgi:hypothetical protein